MTEREETYDLREPDASLGDLFGRLTSDIGDLVGDHVDLLKVELKEEIADAGRGGGLVGGGVVAGLVAALLLSVAAALGFAEVMASAWAFAIVGVAWLLLAGGLALAGRNELTSIDPTPTATKSELERDKQWLTNDIN